MRSRPFVAALLAPLALATATACASAKGGRAKYDATANSATLEVRSNYLSPVDLYLVRDNGFVQRIASQISSSRPTRIRLGPSLIGGAGTIRIIAVPLAENGRASTGSIVVRPGDVVQFNISNDLAASSVFVR